MVAQAKSVLAMQEATQNVQLKMQKHKEQVSPGICSRCLLVLSIVVEELLSMMYRI